MEHEQLINKFNVLLKKFNFPQNITSIEDITNIPLTKKQDLQNFNIENAPEPPTMIWNTSGSTNNPTLIYLSRQTYANYLKRMDFVMSNLIEPNLKKQKKIVTNIFDTVDDSRLREKGYTILSSGRAPLDQEELLLFYHRYLITRPNILFAPSSFVYEILNKLKDPNFFDVIIYGGILTSKNFNQNLLKLTNASLFEFYCFTEYMLLSYKQPEEEYFQLIDSNCYLEVIDQNGNFKEKGIGKLIITDLENFSQPIIRYLIGDLVEIKKQNNKTLIKVFGRSDNYIKIKGDLVSKDELITKIMDVLEHDLFIVKITNNKLTLEDSMHIFIREEDFDSKEELLENLTGSYDLQVTVNKLIEKIKSTQTGKKINIIDLRSHSSSPTT